MRPQQADRWRAVLQKLIVELLERVSLSILFFQIAPQLQNFQLADGVKQILRIKDAGGGPPGRPGWCS